MADEAPPPEGAPPPGPPPAGGNDSTWLVDMVVQFMHSPTWNGPVNQFVGEKCVQFDNFVEENKHEYAEMHAEFKTLIDDLLTVHLLEVDILPEDFERQCIEAGLTEDPRLQQVVGQLVAAEDFMSFKQMMVDAHANKQEQAMAGFQAINDAEAEIAAAREAEAVAAAADAAEREQAEASAAAAARPAPAAPAAPGAPPAAVPTYTPVAPTPAPGVPAASSGPGMPTAEQERAFGAGGGHYGRGAMAAGQKKPSNEKAAAIRQALVKSMRG
eukprot:TRINITY_DN27590_c0_g1_i1.p1 TRINITY_DN27590_c0_g1~~TRINITY_DN27590_c0_g1_i1.p1  ORF type:complete len:271 (-),score=88.85 TRINITY_DN27590_c0_g1_i1:164-976(-)